MTRCEDAGSSSSPDAVISIESALLAGFDSVRREFSSVVVTRTAPFTGVIL